MGSVHSLTEINELSSSLFEDGQIFHPSDSFKKNANVQTTGIYDAAKEDRLRFWEKEASCLDWIKPWDKVLEWTPPYAKWFVGARLNACFNCLDRHMNTETRHKTALLWEGENGDEQSFTYENLYFEVQKFSNCLKSLGIKKGDRIAIYLPMIPEAVIAMLACARIGAIHTVVFGGFSSDSLKDRILDAEASLVITADGGFRRGTIIALKEATDRAVKDCPSIKNVVVIERTKQAVAMHPGRDHWYHDLMKESSDVCPIEPMDAEDVLFILYTSGTTGKPKGIVHTTGGYMVGTTMTTRLVFDIKPDDVYWCTADIGWITGHSYVIYGPLSNGMTQLIYEGSPDFPSRNGFVA